MTEFSLARTSAIVLGLLLLPIGIAAPAQAVTCGEVRAMTPAEVAYWAKRLQVPSQHLQALLQTAFCDAARRAQPIIALTDKPQSDRIR